MGLMSRRAEPLMPPTVEQLERELERERSRIRFGKALRSTIAMLMLIAAVTAVVVFAAPVLRIHGSSMEPTLQDGDLLVALRWIPCGNGDIAAFSYGDSVLVKRIIASAGDVVDIQEDGTVLVNGRVLEERYAVERNGGELDIELPFRVPSDTWFVMGDYRSVSIDSRSTAVGCMTQERLIGRVVLRLWPPERFALLPDGNDVGEEDE